MGAFDSLRSCHSDVLKQDIMRGAEPRVPRSSRGAAANPGRGPGEGQQSSKLSYVGSNPTVPANFRWCPTEGSNPDFLITKELFCH